MKFLDNLKISKRLILIFSLIIVLYLVSLSYNIYNIYSTKHDIDYIYNIRLKSIDYLIEADRDAYQSNLAISQCLNTHFQQNNQLFTQKRLEIIENQQQILTRYNKFWTLFKDAGVGHTDKDSLFHIYYNKLTPLAYEIDSALQKQNFKYAEQIYTSDYNEAFDLMRTVLDQLTEINLTSAEQEYLSSIVSIKRIISYSVLIFLIILVLILVSSYFLIISIKKPIERAMNITHKISKGNLVVQIDHIGKDEISMVLTSLKNMITQLRKIVNDINKSAQNVKNASYQISSSANELAQGANEQASSTEEITASIEQIVATINQNTDNSRQTETISQETTSRIIEVNKSVEQTIEAMKNIVQRISIITELANKTDILSVNASIEASKAKEYGKGFAVVATEIKKLAERSQQAAKEINELSISSVAIAENSGKLLSETIPFVQKTAQLVMEITAASLEQNQGSEQINSAILQLNQVTQRNAASAEELSANSEVLTEQAEYLMKSISFFKLDKSDLKVSITEMSEQIRLLQETLKNLQADDYKEED